MMRLGFRRRRRVASSAAGPVLGDFAWSVLSVAPYGGAPWAGEASAGGSGALAFDDAAAGLAPAVGAAVDGATPALCAGSLLQITGTNWETATGTGDHTVMVLAKATARAADNASPVNEDGLFVDASQSAGLFIGTSGMRGFIFDNASKITPYVAFTNDTWTLFKFKRDAGSIYAGINGAAWTVGVACGELAGTGGAVRLAYNYGTDFDGSILMAGIIASAVADADIDDIRAALMTLFPSVSI
jgi:hypothetical protein